jgi:diacylglycerol O-acyltransferase
MPSSGKYKMLESKQSPTRSPPFLSFADQGMVLAHSVGGQQAVIQVIWRYHRPVNLDMLMKFRDHLAHGLLARLVEPARLPFGRYRWCAFSPKFSPLEMDSLPISTDAMQVWIDQQVSLPLDPVSGPAWSMSAQLLNDQSTVVSLVVSHCIADGVTIVRAVMAAVRGERRALSFPSRATNHSTRAITAELLRAAKDFPATLRALIALSKKLSTAQPARRQLKTLTSVDDHNVSFPSCFIRVPLADWNAKEKSFGANRLTLLTAVTAEFAALLGRTSNGNIHLLIPVNRRKRLSDMDANSVSIATLKVTVNTQRERLSELRRHLKSTLLKARREPDLLTSLLPLVPFIPKRAFSAAGHLAMDALATLPVTCSYMGELSGEVLKIDGEAADLIAFRGVDRQAKVCDMEARQGGATLLAGAIPGFLLLNFVAYQPGVVTQSQHLRALVEKLLTNYEIPFEFFDARN